MKRPRSDYKRIRVESQPWRISHRCDLDARNLADDHYNRQSVGADNFVPPGRCVVLKIGNGSDRADAFWVTSWPFAEYVKHAWAGAWMCSAFRNESRYLSSDLITWAIASTLYIWPEPPELGMVTFVDTEKTNPKSDPGYCYIKAGFEPCGYTKGGLVALQLKPERFPEPKRPNGVPLKLIGL